MFTKPAFGAEVRSSRRRLVVCLLLLSFFALGLHAQKADKPARKLLVKTTPDYPWDLRRSRIGGVVRLNLLIAPNGSVDRVTVLGGNPILADTASKAVKRWKYAPADAETNQQVEVQFDPNHSN
ncbi:MAG TPA: energy transducer TonB [Terriglobales bacterium]|nr:energy transducer TonB [Terriglobales bacterium]